MRIAMVCGHFMPEIGYQEVNLAKAFASLGHTVAVFTSGKVSPSSQKILNKDYPLGWHEDKIKGYKILRLPFLFSWGSVILCRGLKKEVLAFRPDLVAIIGIGKVFGYSLLLEKAKRTFKLISFFGDNSDFFKWDSLTFVLTSLKKILVQQLLKKWIYRRAVERCDRLVLYTPETESVLRTYMSRRLKFMLAEKKIASSLGFDSDEFYFDEKERRECRTNLGIADDVCVLITSTRIKRSKSLEKIVDAIAGLHQQGLKLRYILVGFMKDAYEREFREHIAKSSCPDIFLLFPFLDHDSIRKLYCAADIGIWLNAAISIQQAMGAGLPVFLENKPSINHLVENGVNGWLFDKADFSISLPEAIEKFTDFDNGKRKKIHDFNYQNYSYEKIAATLINSI